MRENFCKRKIYRGPTPVLLVLLMVVGGRRGTAGQETVLYGASYYHEYMPYERLEKDVELMQKAGITVVRLGESTWSSWEPRDGEFQFGWMDRVIDRLHRAGIKVLLGTPTYSVPPWLFRKYPEILVSQMTAAPPLSDPVSPTYPGSRYPGAYGPRQNMDITNPKYLFHAERVIRQVVSHYRNHPAIIGFQVDNETGPNGLALPGVHQAFVEYLKNKFGSPATLNEIWGLTYWGQLVQNWDEFPSREGILNPGYKLEWERFQQKIVTDFLAWQARIVREYKRPDQFVTHNFVGGIRTNIDEYEIARHLDITAVNPYHAVQDELDGLAVSLSGDLCRSLKQKSYLVTETNAQTTGWDSRTQYPPYDGQLRLNAFSHVASGANMVAYWHWHSLHYGQETYWKGVLSHDLEPNRVYAEVATIGADLKKVGPQLANLKHKNEVAILYSIDSFNGIRFMPFADRADYLSILHQFYGTLYRLNVGVDFVFPQELNPERYKLVVVPPLYAASDALLTQLSDYVKSGGRVLMALKSGFANEYSTVRWTMAPGPLRAAAGFRYQEFSNLKEPLPLKGDPYKLGQQNRVSNWAELLIPESAQTVASYDHPFFGKFAAITRNSFGKGSLTYEGTVLSDALQRQIVLEELKLAGLTGADQQLPDPVRVKHATTASGRRIHFYLNYSPRPQSFPYPHGPATDLLTSRPVPPTITLPPWSFIIAGDGPGKAP
jgi:beta-galactosidase